MTISPVKGTHRRPVQLSVSSTVPQSLRNGLCNCKSGSPAAAYEPYLTARVFGKDLGLRNLPCDSRSGARSNQDRMAALAIREGALPFSSSDRFGDTKAGQHA